ncbi:hypothetical protein GQ53DRAFT_637773 [Thozetella sp. PMI_491]|nr:hypothetical protein GQ53DRAFT_637773 [Thozetella sp. PMI_491]
MLIVLARCLALKRDCVIRSKARPRRRGRVSTLVNSELVRQPPGYLGTFRINYAVPVKVELDDAVDALRGLHDHTFTSMLFGDNSGDSSERAGQSGSLPKLAQLSNRSDVDPSSWRQPLFDVASAEALLQRFRSSITYLPFINLPDEVTVSHLAATKPFVLLAILSAASGSTTVQKHALYDDEFRKALGLKYASCGERSLELLQGLLIYCAWYPFQLRPKDGQLAHCLRIASDLVNDLHLDDNVLSISNPMSRGVTGDELDKIRAYLAYLYLISTYVVVWKGERDLPIGRPSCASNAIETLERNAQVDGDSTLVALVRMTSLFTRISGTIKERDMQAATDCQRILSTLKQEYFDLQQTTNHMITGLGAMRMQAMFVDIFLDCGSLLALPVSKRYSDTPAFESCPPLFRVYSAIKKIRAFLDFVVNLDDPSLLSFTINDWTRLIVILTLSFRLSFPLAILPDFDSAYARSQLRLDLFLSEMSRGVDITAQMDLLSANRSILGLAKSRYDLRLASLEDPHIVLPVIRTFGCPMMNGSLGTSIEQWEPTLSGSCETAVISEKGKLSFFHDVWTTMTGC